MEIRKTPTRWPADYNDSLAGIYIATTRQLKTLMRRSNTSVGVRLQHSPGRLTLAKTDASRILSASPEVVFVIEPVFNVTRLQHMWTDPVTGQTSNCWRRGWTSKAVKVEVPHITITIWGVGHRAPSPERICDYYRWQTGEIPWSHTFAHLMSQNEWESAAH